MFIIKILIFILFLSSFDSFIMINAQRNPTISFISKDKVVNIGDNLELKCQAQDAESYPVAWTKLSPSADQEQVFISKGQSIIIPSNRHQILYDDRDSTYTLIIEKIQEIDVGIYRCEITTAVNTKIWADVPVIVRIPPVIADNSTRSVITAVGERVTLKCYASGYPTPMISWRREKNRLLPNQMAFYKGNNLTIEHVTKDDRGTYYCVADNGVGQGARRNIGVEVEFPPFVRAGRSLVKQALQYDADLHCHIEAFPSPSIQWYKDGQIINDNQHYQINTFVRTDEFIDTTLRVRRIEKRQFGIYICQANNKLGTNQTMIELSESVNIVCPPACDVGFYLSDATATIDYYHYRFLSIFIIMAIMISR